MKLLLDTSVVLWWMDDPGKLSIPAREAIAEPANQVLVSAVVTWEISIKRGLGKLMAPLDLRDRIRDSGFHELPISIAHTLAIETLPLHHRDPFDRLLVVQAQLEGATLVTADRAIPQYGTSLIQA